MLSHHSNLDYAVAATEAAQAAKAKMEAQISNGRAKAEQVINYVQTNIPTDRVVAGKKLQFEPTPGGVAVKIPTDEIVAETLHRNAINQAGSRVGIPQSYVNDLLAKGQWGCTLAAQNLTELFAHLNGDRFLLRSVKGQVRGFLSDHYRRLDARPILDSFLGGIMKFGATPVDGMVTETKVSVKVVLPFIFEPIPNEVMLIGAEYENSDFGNGALTMNTFVDRLVCTNFARSESLLRQIHLGARLGENIAFSQRTYNLDTQTMASAISDMVEQALSPKSVNDYMALVKAANEKKVDGFQVAEYMKKNLTKTEAETASGAFNSADVEQLPAGNTVWRMSNALSFLAKQADPERAQELQRMAGAVLNKAA
jgi:hypothetical protein